MRALLILATAAMGACASIANDQLRSDAYSAAALSWYGANIQEMLSVWPNPNMRCGGNTVGQPGCAWWRHTNKPNFAAGYDSSTFNYHCECIAYYDAAGVITDIDVKRSLHCDRRFRDQFESMTRKTDFSYSEKS